MEITMQADVLNHVVGAVAKASATRQTGVNTDHILIEVTEKGARFIGTDLEVELLINVPFKSKESKKIAVPATSFSQYLATLEDSEKVTLDIDKSFLTVNAAFGRAKFNIAMADDFPLIKTQKMEKWLEIKGDEFLEIIKKVLFAALKGDDTKPILNGIFIDGTTKGTTFVALDTFRMSVLKTDLKTTDNKGVVVTYKAFVLLDRLLKDSFLINVLGNEVVEVSLSENLELIQFKVGDIIMRVKTIPGTYPDYKSIIPVEFKIKGEIELAQFVTALRRVGVFAQTSITKEVVFEIDKQNLVLLAEAKESGVAKQNIEAKFEGESLPAKVAFQYKFLTEFLSSVDGDTLQIKMIDGLSPVLFSEKGNENYIHIIMPLKI